MKEAYLWKKEGGSVRCSLCNHRCLIADGKRGVCMVRENQKGKLYSLVYGKVIAANIDPVEKKPVYHFYPGHKSYSIASVGCNFRCSFCQNWDISQYPRDNGGRILGRDMSPEQVVGEALRAGCKSLSYTYSEPTVWYEFTKDCGELAHKKGLKNIFVSNGFMTHEMIDDAKFLDVARIDLKSFNDDFYRKVCGGRLEPVLNNLKYFKKKGTWRSRYTPRAEAERLGQGDTADSRVHLQRAWEGDALASLRFPPGLQDDRFVPHAGRDHEARL